MLQSKSYGAKSMDGREGLGVWAEISQRKSGGGCFASLLSVSIMIGNRGFASSHSCFLRAPQDWNSARAASKCRSWLMATPPSAHPSRAGSPRQPCSAALRLHSSPAAAKSHLEVHLGPGWVLQDEVQKCTIRSDYFPAVPSAAAAVFCTGAAWALVWQGVLSRWLQRAAVSDGAYHRASVDRIPSIILYRLNGLRCTPP